MRYGKEYGWMLRLDPATPRGMHACFGVLLVEIILNPLHVHRVEAVIDIMMYHVLKFVPQPIILKLFRLKDQHVQFIIELELGSQTFRHRESF
jgi:hypothetical protein